MRVTIDIETLPSGKYAVMVETPNGPTCGEGLGVEGVCRIAVLSIVDALDECADLGEIEKWVSE